MSYNLIAQEQTSADVSRIIEGIDVAFESIASMQRIKTVLESEIRIDSGLSADAMRMTEIAIEAICLQVGIKPKSTNLPALESFGTGTGRLSGSMLVLESSDNIIVRIWKGILAALKKAWDFIRGLFGFSAEKAKAIEKNMDVAEKKLKDSDNKKTEPEPEKKVQASAKPLKAKKVEKFDDPAMSKFFAYGGHASPKSVSRILKSQGEALDLIEVIVSKCDSFLTNTQDRSSVESFERWTTEFMKGFSHSNIEEHQAHGGYFGNSTSLWCKFDRTMGLKILGTISMDQFLEGSSSSKIDAANTHEIEPLINEVKTYAKKLGELTGKSRSINEVITKASREVEKKLDAGFTIQTDESVAYDKRYQKAFNVGIKLLTFAIGPLLKTVTGTLDQTSKYITKCVDNEVIDPAAAA